MDAAPPALLARLYEIHITEIGFLLNDINELNAFPDLRWTDNADSEARLLAHIDALVLGADLAQNKCIDLIKESEGDELLGALFSLACVNLTSPEINEVLFNAYTEADDIDVYLLAFRHGTRVNFSHDLIPFLQHELSSVRAATIDILGYRGDVDPRRIWPLFHDDDESVKLAAMVAVMRLGFKKGVLAMELVVLENKTMFNEHSVFPLLMLGSQKALSFSRLACQSAHYIKPQYPIYLALSGNEEDIEFILKALKFDDMNLAVLEALGIYGALEGVNTLMKYLSSDDDEEKLAAAKSLNQISGAQLYDLIDVTEKDDDDLSAEDITGKAGGNALAQQPAGERVIKIKQDSIDKKRWLEWWQKNKARFDQSQRYRSGKPYSFFLLLEEMAHPEKSIEDRQRAYNELVIRSGCYIRFEPDWFIDKQVAALKKWQLWWNENKSQLSNQWMFDGKSGG